MNGAASSSLKLRSALLPALLSSIAAAAVLFALPGINAAMDRPIFQNEYRNMGLNLAAHGLMKDVSSPRPTALRLPLYPAFVSLLSSPGDGGQPVRYAQLGLLAISVLLAFNAGALLAGAPAGLLAAAATAAVPQLRQACGFFGVEILFSFTLLTALNAALYWARSPSPRTAVLAGAAIGMTLLCRSTLFLLPPLLLAAARLAADWQRLRRGAWLLLLCAYLPLSPWAARNLALHGAFIPLESFTPAPNLYAASKGELYLPEPWTALSDASREAGKDLFSLDLREKERELWTLALRNISAAPLRYLKTSAIRLLLLWKWWLLLFLPAMAWLALKKPGAPAAVTAAFAAYFSVHALLALDSENSLRYAAPALPLLCALAAAAAISLAGAERGPAPMRKVFVACFSGLAMFSAWTGILLTMETWRYGVKAIPIPGETAQLSDLEAQLAVFPGEAKLHSDIGVLLLLEGRREEAAGRFRTALELDPTSAEYSANLTVALKARLPQTSEAR